MRVEYRAGACTVGPCREIARALGVAANAVDLAISQLEQAGWLKREPGSPPLFSLAASLAALARIDPDGRTWSDGRTEGAAR